MQKSAFISLLLMTVASPAQGLLPNGDFEQGSRGWQKLRFDDPLGATGIKPADVTGQGTSLALFADFRSPSRLSHCDWLSESFLLPPGTWPVSFSVMWQKPNPVQIPDPSSNYIEVHLIDKNNWKVFTGHVPVPRQTNLLERRSFSGQVRIPVPGYYKAFINIRHSEKSKLSFVAWVDGIMVGSPQWGLFGAGCPGAGSFVPTIAATGSPNVGALDWAIDLTRAQAPTLALLGLGTSNTGGWAGLALPYPLGGGCQLLVSLELCLSRPVSGSGAGTGMTTISLPIPADPQLKGSRLYAQWLVADPGSASPLGLAVSQGLTFQIR